MLFLWSGCANEPTPQQAALNGFTASWDSTTTLVTVQVTGIIEAQEEAQELIGAVDTLSSAPASDIKSQLEQQLQALGKASEASFAFVNRWQEGASTLNTIKEGKPDNVSPEKLKALSALEEAGQRQAADWAAQLDTAQAVFQEARQLLGQ